MSVITVLGQWLAALWIALGLLFAAVFGGREMEGWWPEPWWPLALWLGIGITSYLTLTWGNRRS